MHEYFFRPVSLPLDAATHGFLLLCLRSLWHPDSLAQAADLARQEEIQWEALCQTAGNAGVAPLLYGCVRDRALMPPLFEQTLQWAYQQSAMSNAMLSVELNRLLKQLAEVSLPAIVLKGAALGDTLYGNSALRPMTDVDLLLHPRDMARALDLLQVRGYAWNEIEPHPGLRLEFENELVLRAPGAIPSPIELHWHLIDSPYFQRQVDETWYWQTAQRVTVADTQALVLGLEANLLYLSAHYVLHHRAQGLRWLVDIAALVASQQARIDWPLLLAQAQAFHLVASVQIVLGQLTGEWESPIPPAVLEEAQRLPVSPEERQVVTRLLAEQRPVLSRFWADLAAMPDWRLRLRYGAAQVFPSYAYMQDRYRPAHLWLLPLTYPYRWALGIKGLAASRLSGAQRSDGL
jgi:hypothetical protein